MAVPGQVGCRSLVLVIETVIIINQVLKKIKIVNKTFSTIASAPYVLLRQQMIWFNFKLISKHIGK